MGPVPDEPAMGTGPKVWLRSFSRALPVGRTAAGFAAAAMLPKDMTHAVPISGWAASFYSGDRADRTGVVEGKSESVRVDFGGRRVIKKKRQTIHVAYGSK